MPDKKSPDNDEASGGGSKKLIVSAVLCVALLGVGYFLGGMMGGGAAEETAAPAAGEADAEAAVEAAAETHEVGAVVDLEAININLAENHYLRIAVSLGLHPDVKLDDGHGGGGGIHTAPAADLVLTTFSGRDIAELATPEGREEVRTELLEHLAEHYHGDVVSVYFTEFVMQ